MKSPTTSLYLAVAVTDNPCVDDLIATVRRVCLSRGIEVRDPKEHGSLFGPGEFKAVLLDADLVVIDLSLERPSCYFELGVSHALGKDCLLLAREGTVIHQVDDPTVINFYSDLVEVEALVVRYLDRGRRRAALHG